MTNEEILKGCEHDGSYIPIEEVKRLMNEARKEAIAEHESSQPKLSPEIFNAEQLKRVSRMLKELSEESWRGAGGNIQDWEKWYKKRSTQHLNNREAGSDDSKKVRNL